MKNDIDALKALRVFYQAGYDSLLAQSQVQGFFVSDCGILFAREGNSIEKLKQILSVVKLLNTKMLENDYMLTTSIAYGTFDYQGKLEFDGIEKNPIYGYAYVQAFLDNENGRPKIQPGQCRIIKRNLPIDIDLSHVEFKLLEEEAHDSKHIYYYWNVSEMEDIDNFRQLYKNSYNLKFAGMLKALKNNRVINR